MLLSCAKVFCRKAVAKMATKKNIFLPVEIMEELFRAIECVFIVFDLMYNKIITGPENSGHKELYIKSYLKTLNRYANIWYGRMITSDKIFDVWITL